MNSTILEHIRIHGFYLIPGAPNTTHVTHATYRNYGLFKSVYRYNIVKMNEYRVSDKIDKKNIQQYDILILIFGGGSQEIYLQMNSSDKFLVGHHQI